MHQLITNILIASEHFLRLLDLHLSLILQWETQVPTVFVLYFHLQGVTISDLGESVFNNAQCCQ